MAGHGWLWGGRSKTQRDGRLVPLFGSYAVIILFFPYAFRAVTMSRLCLLTSDTSQAGEGSIEQCWTLEQGSEG